MQCDNRLYYYLMPSINTNSNLQLCNWNLVHAQWWNELLTGWMEQSSVSGTTIGAVMPSAFISAECNSSKYHHWHCGRTVLTVPQIPI
jgi:hypothetical protein